MRKEEIYAKNDLVFKMIFGNPNNHEVLIGFLQSVLDIPKEEYDTIELVDPNFRIDELGGKLGYFLEGENRITTFTSQKQKYQQKKHKL